MNNAAQYYVTSSIVLSREAKKLWNRMNMHIFFAVRLYECGTTPELSPTNVSVSLGNKLEKNMS